HGQRRAVPRDGLQRDRVQAHDLIGVQQPLLQEDRQRSAPGHQPCAAAVLRHQPARGVQAFRAVVADSRHASAPVSARPWTIFSGVAGRSRMRTPTASAMALTMAAATGMVAGSATPLAPYGPSGSGISTSTLSISGGTSDAAGIL